MNQDHHEHQKKCLLDSVILSKPNKETIFKQAQLRMVLKKERRKLEKDPEEKITSGGSGNERPVVVLGFLQDNKENYWPLERENLNIKV